MSSALRLLVAYDGTAFSGWQVQPGLRTVQGVLEDALSSLVAAPVRVRAAGRTDAGVHALGQVVSVDDWDGPAPGDVLRAMQGKLPSDASVLDAQSGPDGFDARGSARWRTYNYLIWNNPTRHAMLDATTLWVRDPIDLSRFSEALKVVEGRHDFSSFARVRPDQTPHRTVFEASCTSEGPLVSVRVAGDAFLHQMVRSIVGSALEVASGRRSVSWMREALLARDRASAGPVAPPHGLCLVEVGYEDASWPRRPATPWPWTAATIRGRDEVVGGTR